MKLTIPSRLFLVRFREGKPASIKATFMSDTPFRYYKWFRMFLPNKMLKTKSMKLPIKRVINYWKPRITRSPRENGIERITIQE